MPNVRAYQEDGKKCIDIYPGEEFTLSDIIKLAQYQFGKDPSKVSITPYKFQGVVPAIKLFTNS